MQNQHPDNRFLVSPARKKMRHNTGKLKRATLALKGRLIIY